MEPGAATRYLQPRRFCVAVAAAAATLGDLGAGSFPLLYALVADEVGIPHAINLCSQNGNGSNPPNVSIKSYSEMLEVLRRIPFVANDNMIDQAGMDDAAAEAADLAELLQVVLDVLLQSPDGLSDAAELMEPQSDPAMHGAYEADGVISCYLRKICVAFASITFEAQNRLHNDLRMYVQAHVPEMPHAYSKRKEFPTSTMTRKFALDLGNGLPVESRKDFETVTNLFTTSRENVSATNVAILSMSVNGPDKRTDMTVPTTEYVVHLEAQRRRDFATAVDALHRYFDLSLVEIGRQSASTNKALRKQTANASGKDTSNDVPRHEIQGHQYAALSLGVLHAQFGNTDYASISLHDTIRAAQQCGDEACQARALSWIARTSPVTKRHQLLRHANEPLALAREELCTVFTPVSESVPDSIHLNALGSPGKRTGDQKPDSLQCNTAAARFSRIQSRIGFKNSENRADALLLSSAAWESHAATPTALTLAKMALLVTERDNPGRLSTGKVGALIAVASLMAIEGDYAKAVAILKEARGGEAETAQASPEKSCSAPEEELLSRCLTWIDFEHCLQRYETGKAGKLCETLTALAESSMHTTLAFQQEDFILDALEAKCKWHLACQATQEAAKEAEALCRRAAGFARPVRVVEGLRLRAEAHLMAGSSSSALPIVLAAVSLSNGLGLEAAHVKSVLTLTETILHLEEGEPAVSGADALRALLPVLPKALSGLGVQVRARAYRLHAECLLARTVTLSTKPNDEVVRLLELARKYYEVCEDVVGVRDCNYLLARVHNVRGDLRNRNACSSQFKKQMQLISRRQSMLSFADG